MTVKIVGISVSALVLSACSSMFLPQGSEHYDCNRKENANSPYCHSFRGAESSTDSSLPKTRYDQSVKMSELDKLQGIEAASTTKTTPATTTSNPTQALPGMARPAPMDGAPVRDGPVVQRVWIKRHVDENDMLVGDMVVYKEIQPTHWSGFPAGGSDIKEQNVYPHYPSAVSEKPVEPQASQIPSTGSNLVQPTSAVPSSDPVSASSGQNDANNLPQ